VQSQLKMDRDVPNVFRQKRVADVMQEVGRCKCSLTYLRQGKFGETVFVVVIVNVIFEF